jgi:hypothetical protein
VGRKVVHWAAKHDDDHSKDSEDMPDVWVGPQQSVDIQYPSVWEGAFRSCREDQICHHPAVRGEVCLNCYEGKNWFDVSAVDNATDQTGIHWLRANDRPDHPEGYSGCEKFPCPTCYLNPNDEQTKRPTFADLTCEMWG